MADLRISSSAICSTRTPQITSLICGLAGFSAALGEDGFEVRPGGEVGGERLLAVAGQPEDARAEPAFRAGARRRHAGGSAMIRRLVGRRAA